MCFQQVECCDIRGPDLLSPVFDLRARAGPPPDGFPNLAVNADVLAFEVSVVGPATIERENIVGFPIFKTHLFGESLRVEIVASL